MRTLYPSLTPHAQFQPTVPRPHDSLSPTSPCPRPSPKSSNEITNLDQADTPVRSPVIRYQALSPFASSAPYRPSPLRPLSAVASPVSPGLSPGEPPCLDDEDYQQLGARIHALLDTVGEVLKAYSRLSGGIVHLNALHGFYARVMDLMERLEGPSRPASSLSSTSTEDDHHLDHANEGCAMPIIGPNRRDSTTLGEQDVRHGQRVHSGEQHSHSSSPNGFSISPLHKPDDNIPADVDRLERDWWSSEVVAAWYGPQPFLRYQRQQQLLAANNRLSSPFVPRGHQWDPSDGGCSRDEATSPDNVTIKLGPLSFQRAQSGRATTPSPVRIVEAGCNEVSQSSGQTGDPRRPDAAVAKGSEGEHSANRAPPQAGQPRVRQVSQPGLLRNTGVSEEYSYDRAYTGSGSRAGSGENTIGWLSRNHATSGAPHSTSGRVGQKIIGSAVGPARKAGTGKVLVRRDASYVGLDDE